MASSNVARTIQMISIQRIAALRSDATQMQHRRREVAGDLQL